MRVSGALGLEGAWPWIIATAVVCLAAGVLIALGVRYLERGRPRRVAGEAVQGELVGRLRQVGEATGLAVVPEVRVTGRERVVITISGVVPTDEARRQVLGAVDRIARDLRLSARVEDALRVEGPGERAAG
ncbi:MAG TPA: hypothetical protein VNO23_01445 [Candidatus Binatia bacterium]|nr:hypothetical protein [Candidatus Binatia bacterium]